MSVSLLLKDFYGYSQREENSHKLPTYHSWLDSLNEGDSIWLKEFVVGTTNSFLYRSDSIKQISQEKISLKSNRQLNGKSWATAYSTPNGVVFEYKIFP